MPREEAAWILVADDNEINQRVIKGMLEHLPYRVCSVRNGSEVIDALSREHYDLVIMDCLMPVMDGYTATRAIRNHADGRFDPEIPVLAITALAAPGDRDKCLEAGMSDYISKPVVADHLFDKLRNLLGRDTDEESARTDTAQSPPDFVGSLSGRLLADLGAWRREVARLPLPQSLAELGRLAHKIRGAADVFEALGLSRAAGALESAARRDDAASAPALRDRLTEELERLENRLQQAR